jgi:hypothetical protein
MEIVPFVVIASHGHTSETFTLNPIPLADYRPWFDRSVNGWILNGLNHHRSSL